MKDSQLGRDDELQSQNSVFEDSLEIKPSKAAVTKHNLLKQESEDIDLDRDSDDEDDLLKLSDDQKILNNDEMKLLGERIGFGGGRK